MSAACWQVLDTCWNFTLLFSSCHLRCASRRQFSADKLSFIMILTYLGVNSFLAGQRPTNWRHHLYHFKVDGDLSHDRHKHRSLQGPRVDVFIREDAKVKPFTDIRAKATHLLLNYFKILNFGPAWNRT